MFSLSYYYSCSALKAFYVNDAEASGIAKEGENSLATAGGRKWRDGMKKRFDQSYKSKLSAAKEQSKTYLEYRKTQVLSSVLPNKTFVARSPAQCFPTKRYNFKDMEFGARKSYFLSLRPNPKFADWHGKKSDTAEAAHTTTTASLSTSMQSDKQYALAHEAHVIMDDEDEMTDERMDRLERMTREQVNFGTEDPFDEGDESKGARSTFPFQVLPNMGRIMFWADPKFATDATDEEASIDVDRISEVLEGKLKLEYAPFKRTVFNPSDKLENLRRADKLFDREKYILANTITSIFNVFPEAMGKAKVDLPPPPPQVAAEIEEAKRAQITWLETIEEYTGPSAQPEPGQAAEEVHPATHHPRAPSRRVRLRRHPLHLSPFLLSPLYLSSPFR